MESSLLTDWHVGDFPPRLPDYEHQPLDRGELHIRLLRVLPDLTKEGYIQCKLENEKADAASYTCLSYTWGQPNPSRWIVIHDRKVLVRLNLWNFLDTARANYPLQLFWIDALCIDQVNIDERNDQVAQMGQIYSAAKRVIVWLGVNSELAALFRTAAHTWPIDVEYHRALQPPALGWGIFVSHKYWSRAWITQEIALSKDCSLLAGNTELHFSKLTQLCEYASLLGNPIPSKFRRYMDHIRGKKIIQRAPLVSLLDSFPNQLCGIPRDRVYSLLSLATDGDQVAVNYGASTKEFIFGIIKACASSMCLCSVDLLVRTMGTWDTYQHEPAATPAPIAQITLWRATNAHQMSKSPDAAPIVFESKFICDQFTGRIFVDGGCQDTVVISKHLGQGSSLGISKETRFKNGVFSADGLGLSLRRASESDDRMWVLRLGVPTLLSGPFFDRSNISQELCHRTRCARGPFSLTEHFP